MRRKIQSIALLLILALAYPSWSYAQEVPASYLQKIWSAKWITVPQTNQNGYGVYIFRKQLELKDAPKSFPIYVTADNRYKLFVNETLVGLGPTKGDIAHWNYDVLDIAPFLKQGKNTITAKVWNEGEYSPEYQISYKTGFLVQGVSEAAQVLNTNNTWICTQDSSYQPIVVNGYAPTDYEKTSVRGYYVAGAGEKIDMKRHIRGWEKVDFDDKNWKKAQAFAPAIPRNTVGLDAGNSWRLTPSPLPQMEMTAQRIEKIRKAEGVAVSESFPKVKTTINIPANTNATLLLDQTFLTNAYPTVIFSNGKDSKITLTYSESLFTSKDKGHRDEIEGKLMIGRKDILLSDGSQNQVFTPLAYRTFRYVELKIETKDIPLALEDIFGTFTGFPFELKAKISTKNEEMKQILDIGWRTARLCAHETYMDCPYYEQLQYIGDTRIQAMVTLYNTGDDRLVKNALNLMDNSRKPEGITASRYPSVNQQIIPTFSLWYIGMLHDYMMYGPDPQFVKNKLGGTRQILDYFESFRDADGSIKNLANWFFVDWADDWSRGMPPIGKDGHSAILDLQLLLAYQYAADLEKNMGIKALGDQYSAKSEALKSMIRHRYWDTNKGLLADTPEKDVFSQHANSMAILAGLVTNKEAKTVGEKLKDDKTLKQASIYFKYYVHLALTKAGFGDEYAAWLDVWRNHIAIGLTTWGEDTDAITTRSDCHAWGASPNIEFYRTILGIDSDGLGFSKVKITPHLGQITHIGGTMPHPKGSLSVNYKLDNNKWTIRITLPKTITGTLVWKSKNVILKEGENTLRLD